MPSSSSSTSSPLPSRLTIQRRAFIPTALLCLTLSCTKAALLLTNSLRSLALIALLLFCYLFLFFSSRLSLLSVLFLFGTVVGVDALAFNELVHFFANYFPLHSSILFAICPPSLVPSP